jgi:hypothetical protein
MVQNFKQFGFALGAVLAISTPTWAESLALNTTPNKASLEQPSPLSRITGVTQFGMPGDQKYIFCDGADCPPSTPKSVSTSKPVIALKNVTPDVIASEPLVVSKPKHISKAKKHKPNKPVQKHNHDCPVGL